MSLLVAAVGWAGAALLLAAYALASAGRLPAAGPAFQSLNLSGAAALTVNGAYHHAWPSAVLNIVWIVIGLTALTLRRTPHVP